MVGWVGDLTARVAHLGRQHARKPRKRQLHTPEAAGSQHGHRRRALLAAALGCDGDLPPEELELPLAWLLPIPGHTRAQRKEHEHSRRARRGQRRHPSRHASRGDPLRAPRVPRGKVNRPPIGQLP